MDSIKPLFRDESFYNYAVLSGLLFFSLAGSSFSSSFLSGWLRQEIGLNAADTGIVFSIFALCAFFTQIIYSIIQDYLGLKKHLLFFIAILLVLAFPSYLTFGFLLQMNLYVGSLFGGMFSSLAFSGGLGILESYTQKVSHRYHFEFGKVRLWGSLGAALAVIVAGGLLNINCNLNFVASSCAGVVFIILVKALKPEHNESGAAQTATQINLNDIYSLVTSHRAWMLSLFIFGTCIYGVFDQQFQIYYVLQFSDIHKGYMMYGYVTAVQIFLEIVVLYFAPAVVNAIGVRNGLILAGFIMALRMIAASIVEGALLISATRLLHALQFPLLLVSLFKYNSRHFDVRFTTMLYMIGFSCLTSFVTAVLSPIAGFSYEKYGFPFSYFIMGISVMLISLCSIFLLQSDRHGQDEVMRCSSEP